MPSESQVESAQRMYNARAADYEESWHPEYSRRFMSLVDIKPGDRILDLACGTGLEAVIAAERVGDEGIVVGVDITPNMLAVAQQKQQADPSLKKRLKLVLHDIANLEGCESVTKGGFDIILCSSAFVLLEDPDQVLAHWYAYLKPGGKLAIDLPSEKFLRSGLFMEKVARRMGLPFPSNRSWIHSIDSFRQKLERHGLVVERADTMEIPGQGTKYLSAGEADGQFDYVLNGPMVQLLVTDELRSKGRLIFKEEWDNAAVDGQVEISGILYIYIARKA